MFAAMGFGILTGSAMSGVIHGAHFSILAVPRTARGCLASTTEHLEDARACPRLAVSRGATFGVELCGDPLEAETLTSGARSQLRGREPSRQAGIRSPLADWRLIGQACDLRRRGPAPTLLSPLSRMAA